MKNPSLHLSKQALPFFLPLLVILSSVFIVVSGIFWQQPDALAIGVTYDLVLTAPLLYLFLIRNKKIPKITVVSFFIGGLLLATFLLPDTYHFHLDLVWTYLFPLVELSLLSLVLYKTSQAIRSLRKNKGTADFLTLLQATTEKVLGNRRVALVLSTELAVVYYSLFSWRKRLPQQASQFSYHRQNGAPAVYSVIIFLLLIETAALHFVAALWSPLFAWILTISSLHVCLQLFGHLRAMHLRPIALGHQRLYVRNGLMGDTEIFFDNIKSVGFVKQAPDNKNTYHLSFLKMLEPYNLAIRLKEPVVVLGMYGIRKTCTTLLLNIDQKEIFKEKLDKNIEGVV